MERAIFRVQLVTPCFLGGAVKQAEWRAASLRGQLRWWYRAVAGAVYAGDLARVRGGEERIFGSTRRSAALRVGALNPPLAQTRDALSQQIREMLPWKEGNSGLPRWTCFSSRSRIYLGRDDHDFGMDAMEKIGAWLIGFRRRYGSPSDERAALRNRDYAWASPKGKDPRGGFPDRVGFGLPLPSKRKTGKTAF